MGTAEFSACAVAFASHQISVMSPVGVRLCPQYGGNARCLVSISFPSSMPLFLSILFTTVPRKNHPRQTPSPDFPWLPYPPHQPRIRSINPSNTFPSQQSMNRRCHYTRGCTFTTPGMWGSLFPNHKYVADPSCDPSKQRYRHVILTHNARPLLF